MNDQFFSVLSNIEIILYVLFVFIHMKKSNKIIVFFYIFLAISYSFYIVFSSEGLENNPFKSVTPEKITDWTKARPQPPEIKTIDGVQTTRGMGDLFAKQLEKQNPYSFEELKNLLLEIKKF